jgi:hypothetical protein
VLASPPKASESNAAKTAREQAAKRQQSLERRIPRVRITVVGLAGSWTLSVDDEVSEQNGEAPVVRRVNPGKHMVLVRVGGVQSESRQKSIVVAEAEERDVELRFAPGPNAVSPGPGGDESSSLPTIGFVGAGAFAIVGTVLLVTRPSKCSEPAPFDCGPDQRKADTMTGGAIGSFVVAAGGVALGFYGLSSHRSSPGPHSASITPVIGFGSLGLGGVF